MNNLTHLFKHPELLNKETLYDLRSIIALHPYYQPARYLLLQNLFLLHDSSFDDELRRAALYISDRNILFQLIEGAHYQLQKRLHHLPNKKLATKKRQKAKHQKTTGQIPLSTIGYNHYLPKKKKKQKRRQLPILIQLPITSVICLSIPLKKKTKSNHN